jgi:NhaP-type Na+/H+ or K+/H+ antiporter
VYTATLFLHSLLRWVVLVLAGVVIVRAAQGLSGKRPFSRTDDKAGLFFMISLDVQLLLGLLLYFALSPMMAGIRASFGAAMKDRTLRFFAVEHVFAMVLGIALVHVGRVAVRRAEDAPSKHKKALLFYALGTFFIIAGIPWPFLPYGRALLALP